MPVSAVLLAAGESTRMGSPKALLPWEGTTLLEYQVQQLLQSRCAEVVVVLGHEAGRLQGLLSTLAHRPLSRVDRRGRQRPLKALDGAGSAGSIYRSQPRVAAGETRSALETGRTLRQAPGNVETEADPTASSPACHCKPLRVVHNSDYRSGKCSSIRAGVEALSPGATGVLILGVDQPRPAWILDLIAERHAASAALITVPLHSGRRGHPPLFAADLFSELRHLSEERQGLRDVLRRHASDVHLVEIDSPLIWVDLNRPEDYQAAQRPT